MAHDSVPVSDIKDINSLAGIQRIAEQKPELIISIRFGQILKDPIISIPSLGVINLHSGKLPDYRGVMATFWAMLDNKEEIGTSLHFIDSCQIDAGKIISSTQQKVNYSQSYLLNVLALYPQGVNNIVSAVNRLNRGETLDTRSMDLASGNYYSFPDSTTLNQFIEQGKQLINYDEIPSIIEKYL
nr:formyl transferase [Aliiglaciecola lipolytica]